MTVACKGCGHLDFAHHGPKGCKGTVVRRSKLRSCGCTAIAYDRCFKCEAVMHGKPTCAACGWHDWCCRPLPPQRKPKKEAAPKEDFIDICAGPATRSGV